MAQRIGPTTVQQLPATGGRGLGVVNSSFIHPLDRQGSSGRIGMARLGQPGLRPLPLGRSDGLKP